jgi:ectoine hydroxylase-related dioxygenase (phytanoyl-CoA dioxygenase family)
MLQDATGFDGQARSGYSKADMERDLSYHGAPLGALFDVPPRLEDSARYRISDEQVAFFRENGFLTGIRVLDQRQLEMLRAELSSLLDAEHPDADLLYEHNRNESADPSKRLFHCLGHWRILRGFHDLLWHPAFTVPAAQLLEGPVRFWHDQLFCKPARDGGVVAWHQDYSYWTRTKPLAHLTCWIALDDSTRDNGCVHFVPGSHRWSLLPKPRLAGDMDAIQEVLTPEQRSAFGPVASEVKAGYASFHHPLTLHGSYENRTDQSRRGAVINVVRDGVASDSHQPLLEGVPVIPKGQPLGGRFFPLLFDPERSG